MTNITPIPSSPDSSKPLPISQKKQLPIVRALQQIIKSGSLPKSNESSLKGRASATPPKKENTDNLQIPVADEKHADKIKSYLSTHMKGYLQEAREATQDLWYPAISQTDELLGTLAVTPSGEALFYLDANRPDKNWSNTGKIEATCDVFSVRTGILYSAVDISDPSFYTQTLRGVQKAKGLPGFLPIHTTTPLSSPYKKPVSSHRLLTERFNSSLTSALENLYSFSSKEKIALAQQLLTGLKALHSKGCIHRNLHPGNLVLTGSANEPMEIKIAGYASICGEDPQERKELHGTAQFIPPEVLTGRNAYMQSNKIDLYLKTITPAWDIYSAGCVLARIFDVDIHNLGKVDESTLSPKSFIKKMVDPDPNNRPSAQDLLDLLPHIQWKKW